MKQLAIKLFAAAAAMLATAFGSYAAQRDTIKVIAIGNSFSRNAIEQNLHELATEAGVPTIIANMYIGGCSLERHYNNSVNDTPDYQYTKITADGIKIRNNNFTLGKALADEDWDYVSFQQNSGSSGIYDTFSPYLGGLISYVRARVPKKTVLLWHQTWAYANDSKHKEFPKYGSDQLKMYQTIMDASRAACNEYGLKVIPCGTAIQNLRGTFLGDSVTKDGYHLNARGCYAAACTWLEAVFGMDPTPLAYYPEDINVNARDAAQACAHAAVADPFKVTSGIFQDIVANYDEQKAGRMELPELMVTSKGKPVKTVRQWERKRRPELLRMFESQMYGKAPGRPKNMHFKVVSCKEDALGGLATRKEVNVYFTRGEEHFMTLLMYTPNNADGPVPAFLGMNFLGNHACTAEDDIMLPDEVKAAGFGEYRIAERGQVASRWPLEMILGSGYGLVTVHRADVDPDWDDNFSNGIHPLFYKKKQTRPEPDEWGTIGAWAWSLSRALDYLETDPSINADKVAVIGHSRLGKTALLAGAEDKRFALVVSNGSGCGGAALSRRNFGETVPRINRNFPHWFCGNFHKYDNSIQDLPFDQHEFLALIAPRPLYIGSGSEDIWADPRGEFLSGWYASPAYELYGLKGLVVPEGSMIPAGADSLGTPGEPRTPEIEKPLQEGMIGHHIHKGKHDISAYDWKQYIRFADRFLK